MNAEEIAKAEEVVNLAKEKGFETHQCRKGEMFRHCKTSNFLCTALSKGKCTRIGGSEGCNYQERGWTVYKPLPASVKAPLSALPCSH